MVELLGYKAHLVILRLSNIETHNYLLQGYETSAVTVSNIVLMLALHPEYQDMVYQEIEAICPDHDTAVTSEDLNQLIYTDRFIKESMRFVPTVPLTARLAKADFYVGKEIIFRIFVYNGCTS